MTCLYCQGPMKVETSSRGITTYGCRSGCTNYQYEEIDAQAAEQTALPGTIPSTHPESGQFAQTAAMT